MSYDFDYFGGKDLLYPIKPTKPTLGRNPDSVEALAWAEALADYERELESYNENRDWYHSELNRRINSLKECVQNDYDITDAQFNVLWHRAWEDGHSEGLHRVVDLFDDFYELASEFAALEKG